MVLVELLSIRQVELSPLRQQVWLRGARPHLRNPEDYQASIGISGARIDLIRTGDGDFIARLTWLRQRHFHLPIG
jgi:hypothetical protein